MKHTRYFSTYLDAYNYYPNGVPSTEIALVGDASYIFVSTDNTYSGNTTFFNAGMTNDQIVDTMTEAAYTTGYTAGTTYGEAIGYTSGYEGGYSYGYSYGYTEGEAEGYDDGYDEGYDDGEAAAAPPKDYFCVHLSNQDGTDLSDTATISLTTASNGGNTSSFSIEWSTDRTNWTSITVDANTTTLTLIASDDYTAYFRGENTDLANLVFSFPDAYATISGHLNSLTLGEDFEEGENSPVIATKMFNGNTKIINVENLIFPNVTDNMCYREMFKGCTALKKAPKILPALYLDYYCYWSMFSGCSALETMPELPAITLAQMCYGSMFSSCTSLAPDYIYIKAETLASGCFQGMFYNCSSLNCPVICLGVETAGTTSMGFMFENCTALTIAPFFPQIIGVNNYSRTTIPFTGCTSLKYLPFGNNIDAEHFGISDQASDAPLIALIFGDNSTGQFDYREIKEWSVSPDNNMQAWQAAAEDIWKFIAVTTSGVDPDNIKNDPNAQ